MEIEIVYKVNKTVKIKVDDKYKKMSTDESAWAEHIKSFSKIVLEKIQEIEDDSTISQNNILGVFDAKNEEVIYEN